MKTQIRIAISSLFLAAAAALAQSGGMTEGGGMDTVYFDDIIIRAESEDDAKRFKVHVTEGYHGMPADTTQLLRRVPGANMNSNGPLTSLAQYRGMFGHRLTQTVDGIPITSAGPNSMDPPLSYAPRLQLRTIEIYRGIAPVSAGFETIGGAIVAKSNKGEFTDSDTPEFHGELNGDLNSNNNGAAYGILGVLATEQHKFFFNGSREDGDDLQFDGERVIAPTVHERKNLKLGYALRTDSSELGFDYSRVETERAGTPALPMDIWYFDGDLLNTDYAFSWGDVGVSGTVYYSDIEHGMNNFSLRTTPPAAPPLAANGDTNRRFIIAESDAVGYTLKTTIAAGDGYVNVGTDADFADHNATIFDPDNNVFRIENINNAERDRVGVYGEYFMPVGDMLDFEFGLRYTRVDSDADAVSARNPYLPGGAVPNVMALRNRFNSADRDQTDHNIDAVFKLNVDVSETVALEFGVGRKTRSPNFLERYLWIPLEINGGLSDGNNYIGDPELDPEIAHEIEFGVNVTTEVIYFRPRAFYRDVHDYIQGLPVHETAIIGPATAISMANGDQTPLQYSEVDAIFFGADLEAGCSLSDHWRTDGVLSWVQGRRDDVSDDLYRIAPINTVLSLTHQQESWFAAVEGVFYLKQNDVSNTNSERKTSGYGIMNLRGQYKFTEHVALSGGVENVFDKKYTDHLAGVNRVIDNPDVARGEKLPGTGRSFYLALNVSW